ncbi:hypothetical protein ACHQM5_027840 [Ranunculus cassubicifolius]
MVEMENEKAEVNGSTGKELALLTCSAGPSSSYAAISADVAPSKFYVYPEPLAKYEEIVANPNVFMTTLEKLHAAMRTKFMIPIIGGKELDLHRLFVEVTARGGIEKVVRERKWKEITSVFKFPSTATNASFILRKYYVSLIHHYEQLYYFGAKGWSRSEPDPLPSPSTPIPNKSPMTPSMPVASLEPQVPPVQQPATKTTYPLGSPVVGVIDGKFEHGYLVTVAIGTQKLHGVLYQVSEHTTNQAPQYHVLNAHNGYTATAPLAVRRRRRRKKSEMKKRDPAHPKPNRSGYNFFFQEHHARLKPLHPGKDREISKMIGELWSNLTETEKTVYQDKGVKDKERYQSEMQVYRDRLKSGQIISDAVPIQQRHAEPAIVMEETVQKMEVEEEKLEVDEEDSEEDDQMEDDSPLTPENASMLSGSDSEERIIDKAESAMDTSVGAVNGAVAGSVAVEGSDFELRQKGQEVETEREVQDLNL